MIELTIVKELEGDIFGQFRAIYLSEKQRSITITNEGHESTVLNLNKKDLVVVDFMKLRNNIKVGDIVTTSNFILTSYAKNPSKGIVVIVTGKFDKTSTV